MLRRFAKRTESHGREVTYIVKKLRAINKILGICENDYDFAKQLFDIEMPNRYNWLISKYREKEGNISEKQKRNFEKLVEYFRREEHL